LRWLGVALLCAGCYDFDALARRFHGDLGGAPDLSTSSPDFAGVDFAGVDLAGVDLARAAQLDLAQVAWVQEPINSSSITLYSVWGSSATDVYAVGDGGAVYHSHGDGNWIFKSTGSSFTLYGVWGSSATDVYAVSSGGEIWHSPGDDTWTKVTTPNPIPAAYGIWGSGPNDIYVACNGGVVAMKGAGGWTNLPALSSSTLKTAWGDGKGNVWIGGDNGILYRRGGTSLTESATPDDINSIWGDGSDVFLVTRGGAVMRSTGNGTWTTAFTWSHELDGIWGSGPSDIHVVGFATHLHGSSATAFAEDPIANDPTGFHYGVWGSDANDVYIVGGRGTILHLKK
jgi:hypothetical protein